MSTICIIPSDDGVGLTEHNSKRRALFFDACCVCRRDYEVRDGRWLRTKDQTGENFDIKICPDCFRTQEEKARRMIAEGKKLLF